MQQQITVQTTVDAPMQQVWDYWSLPEHIMQWNHALDSWHCPFAENDLRVGGKFRYRMEAKDGTMGFDFEGVYDEVIPFTKISYTMPDGRRAITTFEDLNGQIQVTTTFDAEQVNPLQMQKAGWQAILDNFKNYVEMHA
ncbi:MAG: SRPBCC family protein [Thermoflavifilum sp.]|nr:SRPBCC family protein [Thermoflavifilum sp.]